MQKRALGKNGPVVSSVGLGCMSFVGFYGPATDEESYATLARARDLGVDFLDTSNVYGNGRSEQIIGNFIKDHPGFFKIATKVGIRRELGSTVRIFDNSEGHLREELEKSLKQLGVEHIELYYIHRRDPNIEIEDVMETLVKFKQEGKIGGIGFSEIAPYSLRRAHAVHPVAAVQNEYSLWTRLPDLGLIQTCEELGVTFVPFSPLARGVFSTVAPDPATFGEADFRKGNPRFIEPNYSKNLEIIAPFSSMAADMGVSPATLSLAWILHRGDHLIPIPGTRTPDHLEECAAAMHLSLSLAQLDEINRLLPIGFAYGDRYTDGQVFGTERYC